MEPVLKLCKILKYYAHGCKDVKTSLFSVVNNTSVSVSDLNNKVVKIQDWEYKQKMLLNTDPAKQAQEVVSSKKKKKKKNSKIERIKV